MHCMSIEILQLSQPVLTHTQSIPDWHVPLRNDPSRATVIASGDSRARCGR